MKEFMKSLNKSERKNIEQEIFEVMKSAVGSDYAKYILEYEDEITENTTMNDIIGNVLETSSWKDEGYYNNDDIRLAVGRELMARIGH